MNDDLISRQAAIDDVLDLHADHRVSWVDAVIDALETLPPAQPKIVYCKNYIHRPFLSEDYNSESWDAGYSIIFPDYIYAPSNARMVIIIKCQKTIGSVETEKRKTMFNLGFKDNLVLGMSSASLFLFFLQKILKGYPGLMLRSFGLQKKSTPNMTSPIKSSERFRRNSSAFMIL